MLHAVYIRNVKQRFLLYIERWNLHVSAVLLPFVWCVAVFSEVHFSTVRTSEYRKTDCIRVNCDVYDKTSRIKEGVILPSFQELWTYCDTFYNVFLRTFFCHEFIFINVYTFYDLYFDGINDDDNDDDEHVGDFDAFSPKTFSISRFFLRWRWTWRTWRQRTVPFPLDRFSYIFFYSIHVLTLLKLKIE